jgi:paraquat-inducible protein B
VIPSVPSQLDRITSSVSDTLERLSQLPLEDLVEDVRKTLASISQIAGGEQTQASMEALETALTRFASLASSLQQDVPPVVGSLRQAADAAAATLRELRGTAESLDQTLGSNSQLRYDVGQALKQLSSAARSIRELADYLERNPSALIRGR